MNGFPERVVLLGPQRSDPDVGRVVADLGSGAPVALISAGWQEWEQEDARIRDLLGPGAFNLALYGRAEHVWHADADLAAAHRGLQLRVRALRRLYNLRLAGAMDAWVDVLEAGDEADVAGPERADALEAVRALDRHHARRLEELRSEFYDRIDPLTREAVAAQRDEIRRALDPVEIVVIEGGHVPALLNRLRLFGMGEYLAGRTVVACSGGAMTLAARIVFFHDSPPWGPGHAEMGELGLGLISGVLPLPQGSSRLRLDDPGRVSRMAARFAPDVCVVLDPGTRAEWVSGRWTAHGTRHLDGQGRVEAWRGAA